MDRKQVKTENPKDKKIEELTNDLKRVQAEFSNRSKQMDKEKQEFAQYASCAVLCKILPIIDELEIAIQNMKDKDDKKGVQMILDKMKKLLSEEEVKEIKCIGEKFDPFKHEAIEYSKGEKEGIILEELQKGYSIKGKVLRSSKVKVSRLSNGGKQK